MKAGVHRFTFIGDGNEAALSSRVGEIAPWQGSIGRWIPRHGAEGIPDDGTRPEHPANYRAKPDLADAVNTALTLAKPLLLTGNPGTGKSQLAERIAWEFNLGPVLRFEAQSLSEANDLFYRFDLVGHLASVEMLKAAQKHDSEGRLADQLRREDNPLAPEQFVKLGPLGEAIVRSNPNAHQVLFDAVFGPQERAATTEPRPSVVLIDEIDKATRDFPNDLLNGIERLDFRIRELGLTTMDVDERYPPIVIITSNSERDLPAPFLRRCTFFHIEDPTQEELRAIVAQRFFSRSPGGGSASTLPKFYDEVLNHFWSFREQKQDELQYRPGTSELIDWTEALLAIEEVSPAALTGGVQLLKRTASTVSKHKEDQQLLRRFLDGLQPVTSPNRA